MLVLLLASFIGPFPMALVFSGFELGGDAARGADRRHVTQEGESTWFEGVQLLAVYVVLGIVFYFA